MTDLQDEVQNEDPAGLEYHVLGPLAVDSPQGRAKLGGPRQQLVLATLLSHANEVVSQDALIDAVWHGYPPEGGARVLHTYISTLRKTLGSAIKREGGGYALRAGAEQIDAARFEALVAEARDELPGDPASASEHLHQALGLWTGSPFGDLGHEEALMAEVHRLAEARIAAHELRFEADLAIGRHEEILGEIDALVHDNPYRERLAATLMLALYRSGRQSEALRTYAQLRQRLVDELGIEPAPELQQLEDRILAQDPSLAFQTIAGSSAVAHLHGARGYEVHELIGSTPHGAIYRGFQTTIAREVSVLVVDDPVVNSEQFIRSFPSEMQVVSQFEHPHLAPVFDYWREPNWACVITPFYRGGTVETSLGDEPWSLADVLRLSGQVTDALSYLHRHEYPHGAVASSSVALDAEGNAYLIDTGLAYASPGADRPDVATDVQQLASLLYETLTLRSPDGQTAITALRGDLPGDLDHPFARALHPDRERRFRRIQDFDRALRQSVGLDVTAFDDEGPADVIRRNPYKGLRAFHEPDASDFHGRDALIDTMIQTLAATRLLAVVGPSGSGKSSAVRAGLVPRLRLDALPTSSRWLITDMFPGTHPFEELESALLRIAADVQPDLYEMLAGDARGLARAVKQLAATAESEVLLIIDQFEELFSLTASASDRRLFLDSLVAASADERSRVRIVLTLRADFFDRPLEYPEFADPLQAGLVPVTPLTDDGLARSISQPAIRAGLLPEPGLVTQLIADVREEPGGLPLLQYALTELFERREGDVLTLGAYSRIGGVAGAIANRAEAIYSGLSPGGKGAARQLFLRLVSVDELADDTRRRSRQSELMQLEVDRSVMTDVIQQFGAYRLLSFDRDAASRTPTVGLAHEALLREWDRLGTWIDERREDLLIHRRIQVSVQDWEDSDYDPSYLLRGTRLQQSLGWLDRTDIAVSESERRLIEASVEAEQADEAERAAIEAKATRRRNLAIAILGIAAAVATVLGLYAGDQRASAEANAAEATARELSLAALSITEDDPELGILLAAEALRASEEAGAEPLPEALSALWTAYVENRVELRIPNAGAQALAFSPDGTKLAVDSPLADDGSVRVWDPSNGDELVALFKPEVDADLPVTDIAYSPDGRWIAVSRTEGTRSSVAVFEASTGELLRRFPEETGVLLGVDFSDTGLLAAFGDELLVWDVASDRELVRFAGPDDGSRINFSNDVEFLPGTEHAVIGTVSADFQDPRLVAVGGRDGVTLWDSGIDIEPGGIAVSPTGDRVAVADQGSQLVAVYEIGSEQPVFAPVTHPDPVGVAWSPDGERISVSGNEADVTILDAAAGATELVLSGHNASVWKTIFDPDGGRLASVAVNGETRLWDVTKAGPAEGSVAFGDEDINRLEATQDWLVVSLLEAGVRTVNRTTGQAGQSFDFVTPRVFGVVTAAEKNQIAGIRADDTSVVKDLSSGSIAAELPACSGPIGMSDDGRIVILSDYCVGDDQGASGAYDIVTDQFLIPYDEADLWYGAVSPPAGDDGRRFAAIGVFEDGTINTHIWSLEQPRLLGALTGELAGNATLLLAFSPDGRHLGVGVNGPNAMAVDVWALEGGASIEDAVIFNEEVHTSNVPFAKITHDGLIITSGFDGFYRFWDLAAGDLVMEIEVKGLRGGAVNDFSPDFAYFYYEDGNSVIRRMPMDSDEMIALATGSVTRTLTDDECRRYLHTDGCL